MLFGMTNRNLPSRFLKEIPPELCDISGFSFSAAAAGSYSSNPSRTSYSGAGQAAGASPSKPAYRAGSSAQQSKASAAQYQKGMRVRHKVFGDGTVISATPMGGDCLLEIAFDEKGTKKLMSNFVKMEILS